jgi:hypothetical protein
MQSHERSNFLLHDIGTIVLSILVAVIIVKTGILQTILGVSTELQILGSFIAGIFFTSIFTTAPAIVTLGEIAQGNSVLLTALVGAMGATVGDVIIFRFVRDRLSEHLMELVKHNSMGKRIKVLFKLRHFRVFTFFVGGLIIASPFPDELGISILGFSKLSLSRFIPLSLFFNFIGILLIGLIANTL